VTAVLNAIQAQAAGLKRILVASGYQTDLGRHVLYPHMPTAESAPPCIYRAGPISYEATGRPDMLRLSITWAALVSGDPQDLDEIALEAQEDLVRALVNLCPAATVTRLAIPERDSGSNTTIAAVTAVQPIAEVAL
jgi:hypothetical protein